MNLYNVEYKVKNDDIERRIFSGEIRAADLGSVTGGRVIGGYAAKYNELSEIIGNFREKIAPGFFDGVHAFDMRALVNHNPDHVLARSTSGTLKLFPDAIGLRVEITPPAAQWANDLLESIQRGDINQMSFAFTMPPNKAGETWQKDGDSYIRTLIKPARLFEVSIVTFPAYPQTSAAVNSEVAKIRARQAARRRTLELLGLGSSKKKILPQIAANARRRTLELLNFKNRKK